MVRNGLFVAVVRFGFALRCGGKGSGQRGGVGEADSVERGVVVGSGAFLIVVEGWHAPRFNK